MINTVAIETRHIDFVKAGQAGFHGAQGFLQAWVLRPIDMASLTDFIVVLSTGSAFGNFSNVKRGSW